MALVLIAIVARFKEVWPWLVLTVFSLLLVLGSFIPPISPWDLLHQLPVFSSLRVPSRLAVMALFCLAILAAKGVDTLLSLSKYRKSFLAVILFIAVAGINLFISLQVLGQAFPRPPEAPAFNADFRQIEGDPNKLYSAFLANRGTIRAAWLSAYRPGRGILGAGDVNQEWYSEGNVELPNAYSLRIAFHSIWPARPEGRWLFRKGMIRGGIGWTAAKSNPHMT